MGSAFTSKATRDAQYLAAQQRAKILSEEKQIVKQPKKKWYHKLFSWLKKK